MAKWISFSTMLNEDSTLRFRHLFINALIVIVLTLFCSQQYVIAETRNANINNQYPVDFSLSFSQKDADLQSNNVIYLTRENRISVNLFNEVSSGLSIGLIIGSNFITQDKDATTAGMSLNGNHIGFAIKKILGNNPQLGLHAQYLYQEAKGENDLRTASLNWHEWIAEANLQLNLGSRWAIIVGGGAVGLEADRNVSGDINETIRMKLKNDFQGRVTIEINTAPDDRIRLTFNRGASDGILLSFAHAY